MPVSTTTPARRLSSGLRQLKGKVRHVTLGNPTSTIRLGVLTAGVGVSLIFVGVFGFASRCAVPGVPCPTPSPNEILAYGGLVVLVIGVALLFRAGWHGSLVGSALGAVGAVPAAWFVYEIVRQEGCPHLADPVDAQACLAAYGEMTAPVISFGVAGLILLVGRLRWRRPRGARVANADAA